MKSKYHLLYKTTCRFNDRFYIGIHSTDVLEDGYLGSGTVIKNSVAKHGIENHSREIIKIFETRSEAKQAEKLLVSSELLRDPLCMNHKIGGEGGWDFINKHGLGLRSGAKLSEESKAKISKNRTGKFHSQETKDYLSKHNAMKRPEVAEKIKIALTGSLQSKEHKANLSAAIKKWHADRRAAVVLAVA